MLTSKQENFAQAVASGMTQADAYRSSYDAEKMKPETIQSKASVLMAHGMVRARVQELQAELANKSLWTREQSVKVLVDVIGEGDSKAADKISAVKVLNDMQGFNAPAKHTISGEVTTRIELVPLT